mmetsp:Transcript_103541/g.221439  ORF Transcript_103541/g.221439 Transcript_103541/m.221439 type:complete len:257 (+) Transcript_103541:401-1171(+)
MYAQPVSSSTCFCPSAPTRLIKSEGTSLRPSSLVSQVSQSMSISWKIMALSTVELAAARMQRGHRSQISWKTDMICSLGPIMRVVPESGIALQAVVAFVPEHICAGALALPTEKPLKSRDQCVAPCIASSAPGAAGTSRRRAPGLLPSLKQSEKRETSAFEMNCESMLELMSCIWRLLKSCGTPRPRIPSKGPCMSSALSTIRRTPLVMVTAFSPTRTTSVATAASISPLPKEMMIKGEWGGGGTKVDERLVPVKQ